MSDLLILFVFFAALLHASWNIIIKGGSNKLFESALHSLGGGIAAVILLPFFPIPSGEVWLFLCASACCHLTYYICIAFAYKNTAFSLAYPIMRGTAPLLTTIILAFIGVFLSISAILGIIILCVGIILLAIEQKYNEKSEFKGIYFALSVSVAIMAYTIADGYGARIYGNGFIYTCWIYCVNIFPLHIYILLKRRYEYISYFKQRAIYGLSGGVAGLVSYGIAIWAMTKAPIAIVAALRETSIIFGMLLSVVFLKEKISIFRVFAILLVFTGVIILRILGD